MKNSTPTDEIQNLKNSNQYWAATWCLIDKTLFRDDPDVLRDLRTEVGAILKEAMTKSLWTDANKIVRNFQKYLHEVDYDEAQLELNGITIPEDVEEIDERALLL